MGEHDQAVCKRQPEAQAELPASSRHDNPPGRIETDQKLHFACSGGTFDRIFNGSPESIVDLFSSVQFGGKGMMGAAAMTALKEFPNLLHRVEPTKWGWLVHLFEKRPGGVEGPLIGTVPLKHGVSSKDHKAKIRDEIAKWLNRGPSLKREAQEAEAARLADLAKQEEVAARAAKRAAWEEQKTRQASE